MLIMTITVQSITYLRCVRHAIKCEVHLCQGRCVNNEDRQEGQEVTPMKYTSHAS